MGLDTDKLLDLRARHSDLRDHYLTVVEKAREARRDAARMHAEIAVDPEDDDARDLLALPVAELANQPAGILEKAGIDIRLVRRVIAAHAQADRIRQSAEDLAKRVRASQALIDRLNQYAGKFPEAVL